MDTISRENNSTLPVVGVILGAIGIIFGAYGSFQVSKANKVLAAHEEKLARIDDLASQVSSVSAANDKTGKDIAALQSSTQAAVNQIATDLAGIHDTIKHLEESHARPLKGGKKGKGEVVAGAGEYVIKPHDTSKKIAAANGVSAADLRAANPGVNWTKLRVGQIIKLPEAKSAAPAPDASAPAPAPAQ